MTIGPEPTMRILWRSSRRGIYGLQEAVEEIEGVVRTGPRLGVVLHGGAAGLEQGQALDGAVVEVEVRELGGAEVGLPADGLVRVDRPRAGRAEDGEPVVLGGDLDPPRGQILDRVVGAAVAERQ